MCLRMALDELNKRVCELYELSIKADMLWLKNITIMLVLISDSIFCSITILLDWYKSWCIKDIRVVLVFFYKGY